MQDHIGLTLRFVGWNVWVFEVVPFYSGSICCCRRWEHDGRSFSRSHVIPHCYKDQVWNGLFWWSPWPLHTLSGHSKCNKRAAFHQIQMYPDALLHMHAIFRCVFSPFLGDADAVSAQLLEPGWVSPSQLITNEQQRVGLQASRGWINSNTCDEGSVFVCTKTNRF